MEQVVLVASHRSGQHLLKLLRLDYIYLCVYAAVACVHRIIIV